MPKFSDLPTCVVCKKTIKMMEVIDCDDGNELVIYHCHGEIQKFHRHPGLDDLMPKQAFYWQRNNVIESRAV